MIGPKAPVRGAFRKLSAGDAKLRDRRNGLLDAGADRSTWFETVGPVAHAKGWPVYPESKNGKRKPAIVGGKSIRPVKDHLMDRMLPSGDLIAGWVKGAFDQNTAILSGDAADIVIVDADIFDPAAAERIVQIADEILGVSPFMRVCNVPKFALIYRRPRGKLQLGKKILELEDHHDGKIQQIEIKDGTALTIAGHHNTSGNPFRWVRECSPMSHRPEDAPTISEEAVKAFVAKVHAELPINGFDPDKPDRAPSEVEYSDTDVSEIRIPGFKEGFLPAEGMLLTDNRKAGFLLPRAGAWAVNNAGIVAPLSAGKREVSEPGIRTIAREMASEARLYIQLGCQRDDDLTQRSLERVIVPMLRSAAEKVASGTFRAVGTRRVTCNAQPTQVKAPAVKMGVDQTDGEFSWLPAHDKRQAIKGVTITGSDPVAARSRALIKNRQEIMSRTSRAVRRAIDSWLLQVAIRDPEGQTPPPTLLLKAPTGAGKTTALIEGIARFKAAYPDLVLGPILMLLPGYSNIHELEAREDLGVWTQTTEDRAAEIVAEAGGHGLRLMVFKGKIAAGCQESEKVSELQRRGVSSSGLCYRKDPMDGQDEDGHRKLSYRESWCRYHPENPTLDPRDTPCENILQKLQVPISDLILAPHAFIHVNVPTVLKACKAVVIDERIWDKCVGHATIPLATFLRERGAPPPTKKQWKQNPDIDMSYAVDARKDAVEVLLNALRENRDPAADLLDLKLDFGNGRTKTGEQTIEDALAVTGRGQRGSLEISPGMHIAAIREITGKPQGQHLAEEHRTWTIVAERMETLKADRLAGRGARKTTHGHTDARLQCLKDTSVNPPFESLRLSWRRKRNFESHPTLFLDASGSKRILERLWGREIEVETIEASEHRRVLLVPDASFSKSSIIPTLDDTASTIYGKSARINLLRDALYTTSAMFGFGGVVAAAALGVRRLIDDLGWATPENMHWMHFGAIRGLDFAKHHSAAISIGSIAPSWRDIDAYTGAFSYDDPSPETPIDAYGNGLQSKEPGSEEIVQPTVTASYPARDGGSVIIENVADFEAPWASAVYHQIREEELLQFGGRLRAVYREGRAPVWVILGKVVPAGVIVDEVVSLADLARPLGRATRSLEVVRQSEGLVAVRGTYSPSVEVTTQAAVEKLLSALASNPRLAEGFHEVAFTPRNEREERTAWVNSATGHDPVALLTDRLGFPLSEPAWLVRAARMVPFGLPDTSKPVFGLRELAIIAEREAALENNAVVDEQGAWNTERPDEAPIAIGERLPILALPTGTREERSAAELEAKVEALARIDRGYLKWDEKRLGIKTGRMAVDVDTFLLAEQLMSREKSPEVPNTESEANSTSLPEAVPAEGAIPVVPVTIGWTLEDLEGHWSPLANCEVATAENVIATPHRAEPERKPRLAWSSIGAAGTKASG